MTDSDHDLTAPKAQFFRLPLSLIDYILTLNLTGTQHDLLLLLWKLDPYGDRFVEIPNPQQLALVLKVNARTVERAAQRLADCELFEFQIERWKARNCKGSTSLSDFPTDKEIQLMTKRSKRRQKDPIVETGISLSVGKNGRSPEALQNGNSGNGKCTNNNQQTLLETTEQDSVFSDINREGIGTDFLLELITSAGIRTNKTILKAVEKLHRSDPNAIKITKNAISALREQQAQGAVRNPGGFFLTALRHNFTANEAKRNAKEKRTARAPTPAVFDQIAISQQIDTYLLDGRRDWAIAKLKQLQTDHPEQLAELLSIRRDWQITPNDLED